MGGHENSDPTCSSVIDHVPELTTGHRVHTTGRFVQENNLRAMENGHGKSQLLFPAQWQVTYHLPCLRFQTQGLNEPGASFTDLCSGNTINASELFDVFQYAQVFVQGELLAHKANVLFDGFLLLVHNNPRHRQEDSRLGKEWFSPF